MRLAESSGRLHDVGGMLDQMTPQEMDAVQAYDNVHGVGPTRLLEVVRRGLARLILAWGNDHNLDVETVEKEIDPWLERE